MHNETDFGKSSASIQRRSNEDQSEVVALVSGNWGRMRSHTEAPDLGSTSLALPVMDAWHGNFWKAVKALQICVSFSRGLPTFSPGKHFSPLLPCNESQGGFSSEQCNRNLTLNKKAQ